MMQQFVQKVSTPIHALVIFAKANSFETLFEGSRNGHLILISQPCEIYIRHQINLIY
jgi:hypothetical protein